MAKFSFEEKLRAVEYYFEKNASLRTVSRKFNITRSILMEWINIYEKHGTEGLQKKNQSYSGEFKINVIEYKKEHNLSARQTAAEFNIKSYKSISRWENIYMEKGSVGLLETSNTKEKSEKVDYKKDSKKELIAEIKRLRMENDYLKKLNALVQKKEK